MYITRPSLEFVDSIFLTLHSIRPHQMVYQLSLVILSILLIGQYSVIQLISALIVILLITPTFLLLNDVLHKEDDEKVGQKRVLMSGNTNKRLFQGSFIIITVVLLINSVLALLFYYGLFITTLVYGYAKHKRMMYISYGGRMICGVLTFLLYYSVFSQEYSSILLTIALIVGLYDLAGNIGGDLRDRVKDKRAGIHTIVTKIGEERAVNIINIIRVN